jgi:Dolichyl-phosphate-mannose-protein mannosyltransferase
MFRLRALATPTYALLAVIVAAGLVPRLVNNDYGLPYVYNYDEDTHFTSRAVEMFGKGSFDPGYYQNPSAFTYLVHLALRARYSDLPAVGSLSHLDLPAVSQQFALDPTSIWLTARTVAALLAIAGVIAIFIVGKRLFDARVGLVAAALLCFSFLPVAYSRIAVTDVGTFVPVAIAMYGAVRAWEDGSRGHYVLAGAGTGLALGFKYTAGLVLVPLIVAAALRLRDGDRDAIRNTILACVAIVVVFFVTNPYVFIEARRAAYGVFKQAEAAGGTKKFGQEQGSGFSYYLETLTWGFGWAALALSALGAVLLFRRDRVRGLLFAVFPIALFLYMSIQSRFFARWLLPLYPVLALLAAYALVRAVDALRAGPGVRAAALAVLTAAVLIQPVAADIRTTELLGREDTRQMARDFLVDRFGRDLRVAIEPAVPDSYYKLSRKDPKDPHGLVPSPCPGFSKFAAAGEGRLDRNCLPIDERQFIAGFLRDIRRSVSTAEVVGMTAYARTLRPETIDFYRRKGFCLVMTMSVVRGRAENAKDPQALGYYERIERESDLIFRASPYDRGAKPVKFDFDLSYNYYPTAFARPGPEVRIYRLRNCRQGYRKVPEAPKALAGIEKGEGTSFQGFK